ncbi:MAG: FecR domain-containing protein [Prevotella sp.]|nr:FecR domain-containing protein [Prevotella sp.]
MAEMENMEERQMGELVRMNHRLNSAKMPDVDAEWEAFRKQKGFSKQEAAHDEQPVAERTKRPLWHLYVSALAGAAAMLLVVFTLRHQLFPEQHPSTSPNDVMAMVYDEGPQRVALQSEGSKAVDITQRDSISFYPAAQSPSLIAKSNAVGYKMQHLSTPRGMDYKVILADGTEVWLNAESHIEFPSNFQGKERRVKLLGEAYFKVARNEQAPFIVSTEQMEVKVLGTEFNLKSYSKEAAHVTLVKGSVEVGDTKLVPGEDAWYDKDGRLQVAEVDVYDVVQWKDGFFYFNDQSLVTVLRELGRWYNLGVVFRNASAMKQKVHFSALREGTIGDALSSLNGLRKVKITLQDNNIVVE